MNQSKITFHNSKTSDVEIIYCKDSNISYPEHNHISIYTIGFVLDGHIVLKRKKEQITCEAGDVFVIPPYEPHCIQAQDNYTMLTVCLNPEFLTEHNADDTLKILQERIPDIVQDSLMLEGLILALSDAVHNLYSSSLDCPFSVDKPIDSAKDILENLPEDDLPIDQLSKNIYISKYHLIRTFKEQIGLTPHQFQMQNRVRKAQHLLKAGRTITEVALATGFCDQSHFNKWFKKIVGLTPSEYLCACKDAPNENVR